jgi:putative ABC transport system substrate-binding protein
MAQGATAKRVAWIRTIQIDGDVRVLPGQLRDIVADLARRQLSVIIGNPPPAIVAKSATLIIPIVFITGVDPVRLGLVVSFNCPGRNVT